MKRNIRTISIIIFFALFVLYAGFEVAKLYRGPSLVINTPNDMSTVDNPLVEVTGTAQRVAYIKINGRQIFADTKGYFSDKLLLLPGYNIISIEVNDKFGKAISKEVRMWHTQKTSNI
jgi:hypothetical protein